MGIPMYFLGDKEMNFKEWIIEVGDPTFQEREIHAPCVHCGKWQHFTRECAAPFVWEITNMGCTRCKSTNNFRIIFQSPFAEPLLEIRKHLQKIDELILQLINEHQPRFFEEKEEKEAQEIYDHVIPRKNNFET